METFNFEELQNSILDDVFSRLTDDIDENVKLISMRYQNIKNDTFKRVKQQLEVMLFKAYTFKYFIKESNLNADFKKFITDNDYYEQILDKSNEFLDENYGKEFYEQALEFIKLKDYVTAGIMFKQSALQGNASGQYNYGVTVANGEGVEKDLLESSFWYWLASKNGNYKAMMNLGVNYRSGLGVHPNLLQTAYWYAKASLSLTLPQAVYNLGLLLFHGEVMKGNEVIGKNLMTVAERMNEESSLEYITNISTQIINVLSPIVYNV